MDELDIKIIELLKKSSRMTSSEISKNINLSVPAVSERIRKLEDGGVIKRYTLELNREKFGLNLLAFIFVSIDRTENINNFMQAMLNCNEVLECHHIAGEYDYLLKVLVESTGRLEDFISNKMKKRMGISK